MATIQGKKIILGVCAGIAAYKAAFLLRLLVKSGAEVQVVMTPDARSFITPLTLSALSGKPVLIDYFDTETGSWNNHVHLALWADLILIAPTTANTLAKFASGACDNLMTAIYLSARSPVLIAPAMDLDMWAHSATQQNVEKVRTYGNVIIPPGSGELASGLVGEGRMAEPEEIITFLHEFFDTHVASDVSASPLQGQRVLVTAGPTYEAIDPVRFIGNHSSGKMGFALAQALADAGAVVTLVHGPVSLPMPQHPNIHLFAVISAAQMLEACLDKGSDAELIVMAAAVADYTPETTAVQKIKKAGADTGLQLVLKKTTDILAELGRRKTEKQFIVGFALETENEEANAQSKLQRKNLDMIVLNSLQDQGAGFGTDTNKVTIFTKSGERIPLPLKTKSQTAADIVQCIVQQRTLLKA